MDMSTTTCAPPSFLETATTMEVPQDSYIEAGWTDLGPPNADDEQIAERIDWESFVDFEYQATNTIASIPKPLVNETYSQDAAHFAGMSSSDGLVLNTQDVFPSAELDFPFMDEWWAELSNDDVEHEHNQSESLAGPSTSQGNTPRPDSDSPGYVGSQDESDNRKRRKRLPAEAKKLLVDCFESHKDDPYFGKEHMQRLATATGLSVRQVQTFFANARARKLPRPSMDSKGVDMPVPLNQQGPMERFLSSSPEDEGISEDAVRAAANKMERPIKPLRSRKEKSPSIRSSSQSSKSNSSSASLKSLDSRGSRRGRKRQHEISHSTTKSIFRKPSNPSRIYQCTFCTLDFEQRYDWKRHEESVHFPQKEWVCCPNGPVENSKCVFCGLVVGDAVEEHLKSHKSAACSEVPRAQRSFQRKDKLVQHIKQVHGCQAPTMMKEWWRRIERDVLLLCGFCSLELPDWKSRAE